jgi:hypothetical protein
MTQSQSNWLNMFCAVQKYCQSQRTLVEKNPALACGVNSLGQLIASIRCITLWIPEPGYTPLHPNALRESVCTLSRSLCTQAISFAKDQNNAELENQLEFSKEDYLTLANTEVKLKLQLHFELVQLLAPRLAVYGQNSMALKAWEQVLNNFMPILDSPRAAMHRRKQLLVLFNQLFKDALTLCSDYLDPLADSLRKKQPEFYEAYTRLRKTDNPGEHGVKIKGTVKSRDGNSRKAGIPLSGASITLVETGVVVKSDEEGVFSFRAVKRGAYTLRAEKTGYYTKTSQTLQLKEGESAHIEFELVLAEQLQD